MVTYLLFIALTQKSIQKQTGFIIVVLKRGGFKKNGLKKSARDV